MFTYIALAVEPIFHCGAQLFGGNAASGFENAVRDGQSVVEYSIVSEIAHGKAVEPLQFTGLALAVVLVFDLEFAGKHWNLFTTETRRTRRTRRKRRTLNSEF